MKKDRLLTEGSILPSLLRFALPMMAGNALQQIYNIADTLIVGRVIGTQALAAVGSAYTLLTFLTSLFIGLCMGSGALFSLNAGAGNRSGMRRDIFLSAVFIGGVTLGLTAFCFLLTEPILRFMQVRDAVFSLMERYVRIIFWGMLFTSLYNFYAFLLRSLGNSFAPMVWLCAASVLNILLDLLFVVCFGMGVEGAALGTVLSQALAGIGTACYALTAYPWLRLTKADLCRDGARFAAIVKNDVATGLQQSVMNFGILMIQGLVNTFGVTVMAAFAAGVKIDTFAYMPAQEFANAYSLFISQNCGARKPERVRRGTRLAILTSVAFCAAASLAVFIAAPRLIGLFLTNADAEILAAGTHYLRVEGVLYLGLGILMLLYGYYRGIQRPEISVVLTVVSLGTRVLLSYLLAPRTPLGVTAIWLSIPTGWVLADLTGLLLMPWIGGMKEG